MKKTLLFITCICVLFVQTLSAQNAVYVPSALVANEAARSTLVNSGGIMIEQIGTQTTQPNADGPFYMELNNTNTNLVVNSTANDAILISSTSEKRIKRITLTFRGNNASNIAKPYVGYGDAEGTYTNCIVSPNGNPAGGEITVNYDFTPLSKYAIIVRAAATKLCGTEAPIANTIRISSIAVYDEDATLPLDFLSFTAKSDALGKSANLNWQTTNEVNTKEFIVEKRTATTEFTAIGTKASNNVAGVHNYSFTDNNTFPGVAYYRLKQVDNDGVFKYSQVVSADIKSNLSFNIYPNPTIDKLNVVHESALASSTIKVLNLNGKTLIENAVNTGATTTDINVSGLSSGSYILLYEGVNQQNALKFIKK